MSSDREVPFYKLLVDGQDVDTGVYEYYPKAVAAITEPAAVQAHLRELKLKRINEPDARYVAAQYCVADDDLVERAIKAAKKAAHSLKRTSLAKRSRVVNEIREELVEKKETLISLFIDEGHPRSLAEWEIEGMVAGLSEESINFFKNEIRKEIRFDANERSYLVRKPDGVVCLMPPRNAPCSNSCTAVLSLLPGNSLIIKPPLRTPVATLFFWREIVYPILLRNGLDPCAINIVIGNAKRIMDKWLASTDVNDIIFFGDSEHGLKIGQDIYAAGKKPILELSGNDMLVVWKDADLDKAAIAVTDSFLGSSQICMVPKVVLVHTKVFNEFSEVLLKKVKHIKAGLPNDQNAALTPITRVSDFHSFIADAKRRGGSLLCGGRQINWRNEQDDAGGYVEATVLQIPSDANVYDFDCVKKEGFFPLLPIVKVGGSEADDDAIAESMIDIVNSNEYGLRFSIWLQSPRYLRKFVKYIDNAGLLRVNSRHVGFTHCLGTHGGPKKSGGPFGEMNYFWQKTSHVQGVSRSR